MEKEIYDSALEQIYDELLEVNLTRGTYRVVFSKTGKYILPIAAITEDEALVEAMEYIVHPQDRSFFEAFWNFGTIKERLAEVSGGLSIDIRRKLVTGGYRWCTQILTLIVEPGSGDDILLCYMMDIQDKKEFEVKDQLEREEKGRERNILTGLYNKRAFEKKVREMLDQSRDESYHLISFDIEHFKLFNDWYGHEEGDKFLLYLGTCILEKVRKCNGVGGYYGDDDFMLLLEERAYQVEALEAEVMKWMEGHNMSVGFYPAIGIYRISRKEDAVPTMVDRAILASGSIKGNYAKRITFYERPMKERMENVQGLLNDMKESLEKHHFTVYLQPKCDMRSGKIVGAEALVRWIHPERGMIPVGSFLPDIENIGFIPRLDIYVWRQVCGLLREWLDRGMKVLPISINVSRVDIFEFNLEEVFQGLIDEFNLEPAMLELEITESTYAQNHERMESTIKALRERGFVVLMDDFGSGYSSLNMLKSIDVDILKMDMKFLEDGGADAGKGTEIIESVVNLAKWMKLRVIAEGVENHGQVAFLLDIGCRYGQGFYFYRPLPIEQFEALLLQEREIDYGGLRWNEESVIRLEDFFHLEGGSQAMLNNILGSVALYEAYGAKLEVVKANVNFYNTIEAKMPANDEARLDVLGHLDKKDCLAVLEALSEAEESGNAGSSRVCRYKNDSGKTLCLEMRFFYLRKRDGRKLFYSGVSDVSDYINQQRRLEEVSDEVAFLTESVAGAYYQCSPEEEFRLGYVGEKFFEMLAYTENEVMDLYENSFLNLICEEDRAGVQEAVDSLPEDVMANERYRIQGKNGPFWVADEFRVIKRRGRKFMHGYIRDITDEKERERSLQERAKTDFLTGLFNRSAAESEIKSQLSLMKKENKKGALFILDFDNFKEINDKYGHAYGDEVLADEAMQIRKLFRKNDLICRLGGDEFIVFLEIAEEKNAIEKAGELCKKVQRVFPDGNQQILLSLSVGISIYPLHGTDFTTLYQCADEALYHVKKGGKKGCAMYGKNQKVIEL